MKCKSCGGSLDLTMGSCPSCGTAVELGRLTGILGVVCRKCDSYNEPGARTCAACGQALGREPPPPPAPAARPAPPPPPAAPAPGAPVVRSFQKPGTGAATRFVPSVLRASGEAVPVPGSTGAPGAPGTRCPRCGAAAGDGRFCSNCGQALGPGGGGTQLMGRAPAAAGARAPGALGPGDAKLVVEGGEASGRQTFALDAEAVAAGRDAAPIAFPDDPCLAPLHATFLFRDGALHVRDEGAPGGVYLRLRGLSVPLRPGDSFALGERLLRYSGPLPAPPAPAPDGTRRLGSPRPPAPTTVVEEWLEGGTSGRVFVRGGRTVTLGRAGCAVNLGDDAQLSQVHAELLAEQDGGARLRDLGSSSGTFLRIPPNGERELRDGDQVRIGRQVLRVVVGP